jgi:hypothetical protein
MSPTNEDNLGGQVQALQLGTDAECYRLRR